MFDTPQEAALKAEIAQLRAENNWLRRAVDSGGMYDVREYGVDEVALVRAVDRTVTLPRVAGVRGHLLDDGRWSVVAWQDRIDGNRLEVGYFTNGYSRRHIDDLTFVNHILPKCHERFIKSLSDIFIKQMK